MQCRSASVVLNTVKVACILYEGPGQPNLCSHVFFRSPVNNHILTTMYSYKGPVCNRIMFLAMYSYESPIQPNLCGHIFLRGPGALSSRPNILMHMMVRYNLILSAMYSSGGPVQCKPHSLVFFRGPGTNLSYDNACRT
jgi:hypothetical protein